MTGKVTSPSPDRGTLTKNEQVPITNGCLTNDIEDQGPALRPASLDNKLTRTLI